MKHIQLWLDNTCYYCLQEDKTNTIHILHCNNYRIIKKHDESYNIILKSFQKVDVDVNILQAIIDRLLNHPLNEY